ETAVQVVLAQAHEALGALDPLGDDPGLAQGAQVVGEGGLAGAQPGLLDDLSAPRLTVPGHEPDCGQPVRVGQRGQHPRQLKVLSCWLGYVIHHTASIKQFAGSSIDVVPFDGCRTSSAFELGTPSCRMLPSRHHRLLWTPSASPSTAAARGRGCCDQDPWPAGTPQWRPWWSCSWCPTWCCRRLCSRLRLSSPGRCT